MTAPITAPAAAAAVTQAIDWAAVAPALVLVGAALVVLLADAFRPGTPGFSTAGSLVGITAAAALALALRGSPRETFCLPGTDGAGGCSWRVDDATVAWWLVLLVAAALVVGLLYDAARYGDLPPGEAHFLVLASSAGALAVPAAGDLVTVLVALETVTLPTFALVGLRRRDPRSAEAALKLFVISVICTALSLLGISMVYGATGSVAAGPVSEALASGEAVAPVLGVGMVLTLAAFAFKLAVVPFQVWVPDTYVGAPVPVAAYLSVVSKLAGLAGLAVVLTRFLAPEVSTWSGLMAAAAALTMTVGNLGALRQRNAVRLLAWSSVAQAGYLVVPLAAGGSRGDVQAVQAYALMYAVANLAVFAAVAGAAARWGAVALDDFAGAVRRSPWLGSALVFGLLCLAGLPPAVVGLVAKVAIFERAVDAGLVWLAVVMAVNVALGLVYYLRFVVAVVRPERSPAGEAAGATGPDGIPAAVSPPAAGGASAAGGAAETRVSGARTAVADAPHERLTGAAPMTTAVCCVTLVVLVVLSAFPGLLYAVVSP